MKIRKKYLPLAVLIILLVIAALIFLAFVKEAPEICISSHCFDVRVADDNAERASGLMFVDELEEDAGMIFIFEKQGNYSFWMKNTLIPLDMIWIDENKTVVYLSRNNLPCGDICEPISPEKAAKYVLEINAGLAEKYGLEVGDSVWFHLV